MEPFPYHDALRRAIELSRLCPPAKTFAVGAILFDASGEEVATGYSRETDGVSHAEEVALTKARKSMHDVRGGTMICSLEPCGKRASSPQSCVDLIVAAGLARVVYALAEPPLFFEPSGTAQLKAAGVEVIVLPELAPIVSEINNHLI